MANTDIKSKSAKARNGAGLREKAGKSTRRKKTPPVPPQNSPRSIGVGCNSASLPKIETFRPPTTSDAGYAIAITTNPRVLTGDNSAPAPDFAGTTVETRRVSPKEHEVAEVVTCPAQVEIEIPRDPGEPTRTAQVPAPSRGTIPTHPFTGDEFRVKLLNEVGVNIDLLRDAVNTTKALLNAEKDGEPDNMARLRAADQVYDLTGVKQSRNSGGNGGKVQVEINIADWARGK